MLKRAFELKLLEAIAFSVIACVVSAVTARQNDVLTLVIVPVSAVIMLHIIYLYMPTQLVIAHFLRNYPRILPYTLSIVGIIHIGVIGFLVFGADGFAPLVLFGVAAIPTLILCNVAIGGWAMTNSRERAQ